MKNARSAAFDVLYKIEYEGAYTNIALKDEFLAHGFDERDKRLISAIVYGCVRYKLRLDYVISRFSSVKIKKISEKILIILRMGVFQIMFLDKVPDSAAVNEQVKLAQKMQYKSKGFVNALLRSVSREKESIKYNSLSAFYSYPEELLEFFKAEFSDAEKLMEALNKEKKITIRVNQKKTSADELLCLLEERGIKASKCEIKNALIISGEDFTNLDLYKEGLFTVQGLSSILAVDALEVKEDNFCIDMCAAPGAKSTYIGETAKEVLSFDIHPHKAELIKKNAERMGLLNIKAEARDSSVADSALIKKADRVLCDVPCAGLGIISKKPDIKYSYTKEGHKELKELQQRILRAGAAYVKKGGILVYSTCSLGDFENIDNVNKFLEENDGFVLESIEDILPESLLCESAKKGYINIFPEGEYDGFFIAKMRKI